MAVVLYKDGEAERVAPRSVAGYLKQGYAHGKGNTKPEAPVANKSKTLKTKPEAPADE